MTCDPAKVIILGPSGPVGATGIQGPMGVPGLTGPAGQPGNDIPGIVKDYAGISVPSGYLACDGTTYNIGSYPDLFAAIGTSWGSDGAGTFKVPNLMGRVTVGIDTMSTNISGATMLGMVGGEEYHTLTTDEMPEHTHSMTLNNYHGTQATNNSGWGGDANSNGVFTNTTDSVGLGLPHRIVQPYATLWKIIKY